MIGAPDYTEERRDRDEPDACPTTGPATCPGLGRIYVFSGEDITGAPGTPLVAPALTVQYPDQATAAQQPHLGASLAPIGDVGSCAYDEANLVPTTSSCLGDHSADRSKRHVPMVIPTSSPPRRACPAAMSRAPERRSSSRAATHLLVAALDSPDPQQDSGFGPPAGHPSAPGNLGASGLPDIYLAATGQDLAAGTDQGRGYALNGDVTRRTCSRASTIPRPRPAEGLASLPGSAISRAPTR